jgi:hypothetical protein
VALAWSMEPRVALAWSTGPRVAQVGVVMDHDPNTSFTNQQGP